MEIFARLEAHYRDMCDTEFTIEQGKLWMLQTRVGKRTGRAALRMAVDMVDDPAIRLTHAEALRRITAEHIDGVLHPQFADNSFPVLTKGLGASPGAAVGRVCFTADDAAAAAARGEHVILVRNETSPEDVHGMLAAEGILTARGGLVSHAAVVARGWGKPAVVGAETVRISTADKLVPGRRHRRAGGRGDLDRRLGGHRRRRRGAAHGRRSRRRSSRRSSAGPTTSAPTGSGCAPTRTPATDAANARRLGAEGIGLCRTEHMFLGEDRLPIVRRMILASTDDEETAALEELRVAQRADFLEILEAMDRLAGRRPPARPAAARVPPRHRVAPRETGA